jgi:type II secretory ATPase GspE/PulE/Tfp pilus assembly ATPase PilB-like protein
VSLTLALLAQLPESTTYVNPIKLAALVVTFFLWVLFAQWVDKDTIVVNTFRVLWNIIVLATGFVAMLVAWFVPMFAVGFPVFVVMNLTVMIVYIVHRNRLVRPEDTVMTATHFRRLREEGFSGKKKKKEVKERVRIKGASGILEIPEEDEERELYAQIQDLMFETLWRRASHVELAPAGPERAKVTFLVDGLPVTGEPIPRPAADELVQYTKEIAGLDLEERRKPQSGKISAQVGDNKHLVFVRTDGSTAGEKMAIRVVYNEIDFKVGDLGFNPKQLERVEATKEIPRGLILLSAPPRNGLTTSVYSFTRTHDRFLQNVQIIEYEKELDIDNVTQTIYEPGGELTFGERLLKIVRADPDIIVLPEIRERNAAAVACKAAAEKQKVYVAIQATDVFDALRKWIAAVGDKSLVAKSLLAVANQRLVRKLCGECKEAYKPDAAMMRKLNLPADKVLYRVPEAQYDKRGDPVICQACQGSGYSGRTAVFEWLPVDDGLRDVIRRSSSMSEIQSYAQKRGGLGLQAQALQKVLEGVTSIQEVARVIRGDGGGGKPAVKAKPKPAAKPKSTKAPAKPTEGA